MKLEQAEYRRLLKENTDDTKAIKADTAELLEACMKLQKLSVATTK